MKGFKETGRSHYVTDEEFDRVRANANCTVVDAMDIALLTDQRPADVLKIKRTDIRDGALWIVQNKTGARPGIEITGELAAVIQRINQRPRKAISAFLIQDENGHSRSARERCAHALTRRARWRRWIFSFGTFERKLPPTRETSHIRKSCWLTKIGR